MKKRAIKNIEYRSIEIDFERLGNITGGYIVRPSMDKDSEPVRIVDEETGDVLGTSVSIVSALDSIRSVGQRIKPDIISAGQYFKIFGKKPESFEVS